MVEITKENGFFDDPNWWHNPKHEAAFRIANLNEDYPSHYFENYQAVLVQENIEAYCTYIVIYYSKLTKKTLKNIIEYGSASSLFTRRFRALGYNIHSLDGATGATTQERRDFRRVFNFTETKKYDIALCTEVAEHLEPPFAGILVHNLTNDSDLIWWSSADKGNGIPHYHHPNEQPLKYWINLFAFYDYGCLLLPDEVYNACAARARCIFFNKKVYGFE